MESLQLSDEQVYMDTVEQLMIFRGYTNIRQQKGERDEIYVISD
jgi:hypothetical protein